MLKFSFGALLVLMTFHVGTVNGSKLRTWIGPETFFEGALPSPRQGHAMLSTDDGVLYLFGGWGNSGEILKFKFIYIHINLQGYLAQLAEKFFSNAKFSFL